MKDHISKPVDSAHLIRVLGHWINADAGTTPVIKADIEPTPAPTSAPDSATAFDLTETAARLGLDVPIVLNLLGNFQQRYVTAAADLRSALDANDLDFVREQAHSLKGVSGSLGVTTVYDLAATLEQAARDEDGEKAGHLIDELGPLLEAVFTAIDDASDGAA